MPDAPRDAASNPFCSRFLRPGAVPFIFAEGDALDRLIEQLKAQQWRGEIIGPHGAGKSALLAALISAIEAAGRPVVHVALHNGQRAMPDRVYRRLRATPGAVLVVDGCEQLSWWQRRRLFAAVGKAGAGLVATAHRPLGLPTLCVVRPTADLAASIASRLQDDRPLVTEDEARQAFARHAGDLRETLFSLYDLYQLRQHAVKR